MAIVVRNTPNRRNFLVVACFLREPGFSRDAEIPYKFQLASVKELPTEIS